MEGVVHVTDNLYTQILSRSYIGNHTETLKPWMDDKCTGSRTVLPSDDGVNTRDLGANVYV